MKFFIILIIGFRVIFGNDLYYYKDHKKVILTPYKNIFRNNSDISYYKNERGIILGVADTIIVKVKNGNDIKNLLKKYNLTLIKKLLKNVYIVKVEDKKITIDIANKLYKEKSVEYAYPNFIKKIYHR
jgi:hypothetical protein